MNEQQTPLTPHQTSFSQRKVLIVLSIGLSGCIVIFVVGWFATAWVRFFLLWGMMIWAAAFNALLPPKWIQEWVA